MAPTRSVVVAAATMIWSHSFAQAPPMCQAGQQNAGSETAIHCCWLGQRWDSSRGACTGTPQCPRGWALQGEGCVGGPPVSSPAPAPGVPPASTAPPVVAPTATPPGTLSFVATGRGESGLADRYHVAAGGAECVTPCRLRVTPGTVDVAVRAGALSARRSLSVSNDTRRVEISHSGRSGRVMGAIAVVLGAGALGLGGLVWLSPGFDGQTAVSAVGAATGAVALALGITELALANRISVRTIEGLP